MGLNVVQGAAMVAADPIIAIDLYDHKLDMARKFGATHVINSAKADVVEEVTKIVGRAGVDVFVEKYRPSAPDRTGLQTHGEAGRTILVGVPRHDQDITIHSLPLHFGKVLTGCEGGHTDPTADIPRYLGLYQRGKLKLDEQITHRFGLDEINRALDAVRQGEAGRCVLQMS